MEKRNSKKQSLGHPENSRKADPVPKAEVDDIDLIWQRINELQSGWIFMHEELDKLTDVVNKMSQEINALYEAYED